MESTGIAVTFKITTAWSILRTYGFHIRSAMHGGNWIMKCTSFGIANSQKIRGQYLSSVDFLSMTKFLRLTRAAIMQRHSRTCMSLSKKADQRFRSSKGG